MTAPRYSPATLAALAAWDEARLPGGTWSALSNAYDALCAALDADRARRESAMRAAEDEALARLADRTTALAEAMERDRAQPHRHQYGEPL